MIPRCVLLAALVSCAGCESISGIDDFTTEQTKFDAASDAAKDGSGAEAGQDAAESEVGQDGADGDGDVPEAASGD